MQELANVNANLNTLPLGESGSQARKAPQFGSSHSRVHVKTLPARQLATLPLPAWEGAATHIVA